MSVGTAGVAGASVSTVTLKGAEAALVLPAASAAVVVKVWGPSVRIPVCKLQAPFASAVGVPRTGGASFIVTGVAASAGAGEKRMLFAVVLLPVGGQVLIMARVPHSLF